MDRNVPIFVKMVGYRAAQCARPCGVTGKRHSGRAGFTLVELLVTISIITVLVAILTPAVQMARESARSIECQSQLRQFGMSFLSHAETSGGELCSGAFDWSEDGCVTEIGWVADLVELEVPVGKMLCRSNPYQLSDAYSDLLVLGDGDFTTCVDMKGSEPYTLPDGSTVTNPCRTIIETLAADPAATEFGPDNLSRREFVEKNIFKKHFNTNYTASWYLVRSGALIDGSGNLRQKDATCGDSTASRNCTKGPIDVVGIDTAAMASAFIPLMGDGGAGADFLTEDIGENLSSTGLVISYTPGPRKRADMTRPDLDSSGDPFPAGTPESTWWSVWAKDSVQDFRAFYPVHNGGCNFLFADGSVRQVMDTVEDGMLNNGFTPTATNGFANDKLELQQDEFESLYSLTDKSAHDVN